MTKEEFERISCCKVSDETFGDIATLYMTALGTPQEEFCCDLRGILLPAKGKEYAVLPGTLRSIARSLSERESMEELLREQVRTVQKKSEDLLQFVIERAAEPMEIIFYATKMLGPIRSSIVKIKSDWKLSDEEKELALSLLERELQRK